MSDHGTPAQVRPGFVVRIKLSSSMCYASARMGREDAAILADKIVTSLRWGDPAPLRIDANEDFIEFPAADYERLLVRSSQVRAVEVRPVAADGGAYTPAAEWLRSIRDDLREGQR